MLKKSIKFNFQFSIYSLVYFVLSFNFCNMFLVNKFDWLLDLYNETRTRLQFPLEYLQYFEIQCFFFLRYIGVDNLYVQEVLTPYD